MTHSLVSKLRIWLFEGIGSTRPLGLFRVGLVLLLWTRLGSEMALWQSESWTHLATGLAFFTLTPLAFVGWQTRRVMSLLSVIMVVIYFHLGWDLGYVPFTHHHVYLLVACTVLCSLGPCDRSFSLDSYLARKKKEAWKETGSLVANRLILLQLVAVYFWTAVDKTNLVFLSGTRLEQILWFHYHESLLAPLLLTPLLIKFLAVSVVIVEYLLPILLLISRLAPLAVLLGLLLHGSFFLLLPVQTFSMTMLLMYLMAFRPEEIHRTVSQLTSSTFEKLDQR